VTIIIRILSNIFFHRAKKERKEMVNDILYTFDRKLMKLE